MGRPAHAGRIYFAEIVMPRDTAYIGEAMPIELRFYIDSRIRWQAEESPEITAEGCTIQKVVKPTQAPVMRNGRQYDMVTFKTAVTAAQAGQDPPRPHFLAGDGAGSRGPAAQAPGRGI